MGNDVKIGDAKLAELFIELSARHDQKGLDRLCKKSRMNDEQCRLATVGSGITHNEVGCAEHRLSPEERDMFVGENFSEEFIDRLDTGCPVMARSMYLLETFDDFTARGQMNLLNEFDKYGLFNDTLAARLIALAGGSCVSKPGLNARWQIPCRDFQLKALSMLVKHLGDIKDPALKKEASEAIAGFKRKELPELVEKLRDDAINVQEAVIIFGDIGREDSIPYMLELMRDPSESLFLHPNVMAECFRNMQSRGLGLLVELVRENRSKHSLSLALRTIAALAMRYNGPIEDIGPILQDLLDICMSKEGLVVADSDAITALASIDPRPLIAMVKERIDDQDLVYMLAHTEPPKDKEMNALFFDFLKELALSEDPYVKGNAFIGLSKLPAGRTDLLELAVTGLISGDIDLAKGAMVYLGSRGAASKDALPVLDRIVDDPSQAEVHKPANETMDRIIKNVR